MTPLFTSHGAGRRLIQESLATRDRLGCWPDWPYGHQHGYPTLGANVVVSHVVLEETGSPRPGGEFDALHSCDTPACWNPAHLRWGTHRENMADAAARGRFPAVRPWRRGERNPLAKLSDAQVTEIRRRYRPGRNQWTGAGNGTELAEEFGVSLGTIRRVAHGLSRGEATPPVTTL